MEAVGMDVFEVEHFVMETVEDEVVWVVAVGL
jgi:hypothetical protein